MELILVIGFSITSLLLWRIYAVVEDALSDKRLLDRIEKLEQRLYERRWEEEGEDWKNGPEEC